MVGFRVTKYDPSLRAANGVYTRNEWTSVSDIGRAYGGHIVTLADYLSVESAYVEAVQDFMAASGLRVLRVTDLEKIETGIDSLVTDLTSETLQRTRTIEEGMDVSGGALIWVIRLALREVLWCRLKGEQGFYVHFGRDYYMYIGSDSLGVTPPLLPSGIFAEVFDSPYHREQSES